MMKKAMKLVWMVLFALPLISLTACGDDEPDYDVEIGNITYTTTPSSATFSFNVSAMNLPDATQLSVAYTFESTTTVLPTSTNGKYSFTLNNLQAGKEYSVTITATAGKASDSETESFTIELFKDYSDLLDESEADVMKKMNTKVSYQDENALYYWDLNEDNVEEVDIYYTFFQENEYGGVVTYPESVMVDVWTYGFTEAQVFNYLNNKYRVNNMSGDSTIFTDGDDMYIWMEPETDGGVDYIIVTYVDKEEYDKLAKSVSGINVKKALKARRAARK